MKEARSLARSRAQRTAARRRIGAMLLGAAVFTGCRENPTDLSGSEGSRNPDWSEATHGKKALPNYAAVFPQDSVNRIEIVMSAADWSAVRANMVTLWGFDFGSGGGGPGGGGVGGGGGGFPSIEPSYVPVEVRFGGRLWENVGFRLKGNSSLSTAWRGGNYKLPFRLNFDRFEEQFTDIDDQRFHGFKELSMSSGFGDNSLIREKLVADVFRMAGIPAARTAFYRVYIDFGQGLRYAGVYTVVEVVDDTMVEDQFGDDGANIYKPESRFNAFVATQFEKKNNQEAADYSDVQAAITALNSTLRTTSPAQWRTSLEETFNVDHFLKWLAVNNAIVNWDTYGAIAHNYYLYADPMAKLTWIPWDHNQSMSGSPGLTGGTTGGGGPGGGGPGGGGPGGGGLSLTMNEVTNQWPLIRYLADDPVYFERYKAYMKAFRETEFTDARMNPLIEKYHGLVAPYAVGSNGEQPGYTYLQSAAAFSGAASALEAHVQSRRALIAQFVP